jgi:hypothetical protein
VSAAFIHILILKRGSHPPPSALCCCNCSFRLYVVACECELNSFLIYEGVSSCFLHILAFAHLIHTRTLRMLQIRKQLAHERRYGTAMPNSDGAEGTLLGFSIDEDLVPVVEHVCVVVVIMFCLVEVTSYCFGTVHACRRT